MRLAAQLRVLARGLLALGLPREDVERMLRRVALDSMPAARRAVLEVLSPGEALATAEIARRARAHRHVTRCQLEELEVIGVVASEPTGGDDDSSDRRAVKWRLVGEEGELVAAVVKAARAEEGGWHEMEDDSPRPGITSATETGNTRRH